MLHFETQFVAEKDIQGFKESVTWSFSFETFWTNYILDVLEFTFFFFKLMIPGRHLGKSPLFYL